MSSQDHRLSSSPFVSSPSAFIIIGSSVTIPPHPFAAQAVESLARQAIHAIFNVAQPRMTQSGQGNDSPTSTLSESASFRFNDSASRSAFRTTFTPATNTPVKKTLLRSDPSILTVFDPADYELYDLWAPKN
ncbi:hypothetical protein DFH06DRAFT_1464389 [Mycena polygramma]|nr:hypothetical protein DFH06DRAFT_1464389 [Mycena polygramma]